MAMPTMTKKIGSSGPLEMSGDSAIVPAATSPASTADLQRWARIIPTSARPPTNM